MEAMFETSGHCAGTRDTTTVWPWGLTMWDVERVPDPSERRGSPQADGASLQWSHPFVTHRLGRSLHAYFIACQCFTASCQCTHGWTVLQTSNEFHQSTNRSIKVFHTDEHISGQGIIIRNGHFGVERTVGSIDGTCFGVCKRTLVDLVSQRLYVSIGQTVNQSRRLDGRHHHHLSWSRPFGRKNLWSDVLR